MNILLTQFTVVHHFIVVDLVICWVIEVLLVLVAGLVDWLAGIALVARSLRTLYVTVLSQICVLEMVLVSFALL